MPSVGSQGDVMVGTEQYDEVGRRLGLTEPDPDELSYVGPGDDTGVSDAPAPLDTELPGGLDPNIAAYGGGGGGVFLMAITARLRRRRARRELDRLGDRDS